MKAIFGLGNPDPKFTLTRHNTGFIILDMLKDEFKLDDFSESKPLEALIAKGGDLILAKPLTYMNNSGNSVIKVIKFHKLKPEKILVIHDDLDFETGKIKFCVNRGSAGHKGVESIIKAIGGKNFYRIRIGVGRAAKSEKKSQEKNEYVLSPLGKDLKIIKGKKEKIVEMVRNFLSSG